MAERADFVIAREGGVVLEFATGTPGNPGTFSALGCPKGTWTFGESVAEVDDGIDNWCSAADEAVASFSAGARTITISGTTELILDDAAYLAMKAAIRANDYCFFRYTATNVGATQTETETFGGYLTQFDRQFQGTGPSDVAVTFRANEIVPPPP